MARRLPPRPHGPKSKSKPKGKSKPAARGGPTAADRRRREIHDQPARGPRAQAQATAGGAGELERLHKFLARSGIGSRRSSEQLILQGRVSVDGQVVRELGTKIDPRTQQVEVDGQRVRTERLVYFAVHKPKGYVSTNADPAGRPRVVDLVAQVPERVYSVGRLDEDSTGLLILTNDGMLANKLAHPRFGVEKVYRALVAGLPTRETLDKLVEGVWLSDGKARAKRVRPVGKRGEATLLEMVLAEGKNREVRRMLAKFGHKVMSLQRVAVGPITLKGLSVGQYRHLTTREVDLLRRVAAGESVPTAQFGDREEFRPSRPSTPRRGPARHQPPTRPAREPVIDPKTSKRPAGPRPAGPRPAGPRPTEPRSAGPRPAGPRPAGPRSAGPRPAGGRPMGPPGRVPPRGGPKPRRDREIEVGPEIEATPPPRPIPPRRPSRGPAPRTHRGGPKPGAGGSSRRIIGLDLGGPPSTGPADRPQRPRPGAGPRPQSGPPLKPRSRPLPKPRRGRPPAGEPSPEES